MGLKILTQPTAEPFTIEECRAHLNIQPYEVDSDGVGTHPDDAMIMEKLASAREHCEAFTGLSFAPKVYGLALDGFPAEGIKLFRPPVLEILGVTYIDTEGATREVDPSDYVLDDYQKPAWLLPASGVSWPATGEYINSVKVRYIAGFSDESDGEALPYAARGAIMLMLGHLYANREEATEKALSAIPSGVEALLRPLRIDLGMA